jgi:hypothetical protein
LALNNTLTRHRKGAKGKGRLCAHQSCNMLSLKEAGCMDGRRGKPTRLPLPLACRLLPPPSPSHTPPSPCLSPAAGSLLLPRPCLSPAAGSLPLPLPNICKHKTKFSHAASVVYGLAYWPSVRRSRVQTPSESDFLRLKKILKIVCIIWNNK